MNKQPQKNRRGAGLSPPNEPQANNGLIKGIIALQSQRSLGGDKPAPLHLFFAILFLICNSFIVSAQVITKIHIAAETVVEKDRIELGDLAALDSDDPNMERLKSVALGYAPQPGATREILKEKIVLAIASAGFAEDAVALDCPPKILIRRQSQKVNSAVLRDAVEKAVLANFQAEKVSARITHLEMPENIELESGNVSVRASAANVRNFFAPFAVSLEISVDGRVMRRLSANVEVQASAEVLVAAKDLTAQAKIGAGDFVVETRSLDKPLSSYLRDADRLRGTVLVKNVSAGTELTTEALASGIAVKNGDLVRIIGQSGKIQISVAGEARASGRIGDRIAVKNSASNTILQATVIDEGLVKVIF